MWMMMTKIQTKISGVMPVICVIKSRLKRTAPRSGLRVTVSEAELKVVKGRRREGGAGEVPVRAVRTEAKRRWRRPRHHPTGRRLAKRTEIRIAVVGVMATP
jgi:hypothetical protein